MAAFQPQTGSSLPDVAAAFAWLEKAFVSHHLHGCLAFVMPWQATCSQHVSLQ